MLKCDIHNLPSTVCSLPLVSMFRLWRRQFGPEVVYLCSAADVKSPFFHVRSWNPQILRVVKMLTPGCTSSGSMRG